MFTQTRTNLKFIGVILFTMTFLVGVFFIRTTNVEAAGGAQSFSVSYSLSSVTSIPNNDGGITTTVFIGCVPGSGDIYDINTGKPCISITRKVLTGCAVGSGDLYDINTGKQCTNKTMPVLIGCAVGSGDLYDINTGKQCTNKTMPVLIGCAVGSGDLFDINTGKRCINDTTPIITGCAPGSGDVFDITTGKRCLVSTTPIVSINNVSPKTVAIAKVAPIALAVIEPVNNTDVNNTENQVSGREKIGDSLSAGVAKAGSIFTGPMSIPLILLIIIILLGGGYAIYSLTKKDLPAMPAHAGQAGEKIEVKKIISEPIIQHKTIAPVPPLTHSQVNTPNPVSTTQTMPLNTPQSR